LYPGLLQSKANEPWLRQGHLALKAARRDFAEWLARNVVDVHGFSSETLIRAKRFYLLFRIKGVALWLINVLLSRTDDVCANPADGRPSNIHMGSFG
jgi:hypothetical protein